MKAVSIINFKGGVGKTTLSLHLACYLARDARVLVVDVDHQSSISLIILGSRIWAQKVSSTETINRLFESYTNRRVTMPDSNIIISNPIALRGGGSLYPALDLVPAQFELDDTEIDLASTFYSNPTLSDWEKRTLISTWLDAVDASENYDYVIFDCPPATKIVSQNALAASHGYIIPVIPDELSSRGVTHFSAMVSNKIDAKLAYLHQAARVPNAHMPNSYVAQTQLAAIVPFLVKSAGNAASGMTNIHTEQLAALRRLWGPSLIQNVGTHRIGIPEAVNAGWPVWNYWGTNAKRDVKTMMNAICQELKLRIDAL